MNARQNGRYPSSTLVYDKSATLPSGQRHFKSNCRSSWRLVSRASCVMRSTGTCSALNHEVIDIDRHFGWQQVPDASDGK